MYIYMYIYAYIIYIFTHLLMRIDGHWERWCVCVYVCVCVRVCVRNFFECICIGWMFVCFGDNCRYDVKYQGGCV